MGQNDRSVEFNYLKYANCQKPHNRLILEIKNYTMNNKSGLIIASGAIWRLIDEQAMIKQTHVKLCPIVIMPHKALILI